MKSYSWFIPSWNIRYRNCTAIDKSMRQSIYFSSIDILLNPLVYYNICSNILLVGRQDSVSLFSEIHMFLEINLKTIPSFYPIYNGFVCFVLSLREQAHYFTPELITKCADCTHLWNLAPAGLKILPNIMGKQQRLVTFNWLRASLHF